MSQLNLWSTSDEHRRDVRPSHFETRSEVRVVRKANAYAFAQPWAICSRFGLGHLRKDSVHVRLDYRRLESSWSSWAIRRLTRLGLCGSSSLLIIGEAHQPSDCTSATGSIIDKWRCHGATSACCSRRCLHVHGGSQHDARVYSRRLSRLGCEPDKARRARHRCTGSGGRALTRRNSSRIRP